MVQIRTVLWLYCCPEKDRRLSWIKASEQAAFTYEGGPSLAKMFRTWACTFIADRHALPYERRGVDSKHALYAQNDELHRAIIEHLATVGKYVRALDIVEYLAEPEVQEAFGLKKTVGLSTTQRWMNELGYCWKRTPSGQFVDGHERENVVRYHQETYLPKMAILDIDAPQFDSEHGNPIPVPRVFGPLNRPTLYLFHDESIFYAHDRREICWVPPNETPVPRKKGEGVSLMIADLMSPQLPTGWFCSKDGEKSARVIFHLGKNHDGYFTNPDVLAQLSTAMDICAVDYPEYRVVFVLDNATTHSKRANDALSARKLSKGPTGKEKPIFGVNRNVRGADEKLVYKPDGKLLKEKVRMGDAKLPNGEAQSLYFQEGHPKAGLFKGMVQILEERGYNAVSGLRAECPKFKCPPGATRCCCRRWLFEEPDFRDAESLVEAHCRERGFEVIFLPKFHCELNPIEQCWCVAKCAYREFPPSSIEADLECNVLAALDSVDITKMRRFFNRTQRFTDAYRKGLSGTQAAWACKKYSGHRTLPNGILEKLDHHTNTSAT
ncbi:hypothetical protein BV20DRAFT_942876 [Pilatotrama ljubarskyi]|nr:hypothetical protein BV20DRAFT_942876 [Pilatotrama ljubarskyi]